MSKRVGLTGNMGSGKSTVAAIFNWLGIPVFEADAEARKLFELDSVKEELSQKFGTGVNCNGQVNRKMLASVVFNDQASLEWLNSLIHPMVKTQFEDFSGINSHSPYVLFESAIIFESIFRNYFDKTIVVYSPVEIAIQRVGLRDRLTEDEIHERWRNQMDPLKKNSMADFVIYNDNTQLILPQVLSVHYHLLHLKTQLYH